MKEVLFGRVMEGTSPQTQNRLSMRGIVIWAIAGAAIGVLLGFLFPDMETGHKAILFGLTFGLLNAVYFFVIRKPFQKPE